MGAVLQSGDAQLCLEALWSRCKAFSQHQHCNIQFQQDRLINDPGKARRPEQYHEPKSIIARGCRGP